MTDTLDLERRLLTMHSHLESNDQYAIHLKEAITALASQRQRVEELEGLLAPFAKFACEPPCDCNNCRARAALARKP